MVFVKEDQIWARLENVFKSIFNKPELKITKDMSSWDIEDWDSLTHLQIILALENEFKIQFKPQELLSFKNIGDLYSLILKKCGDLN